MALFDVRWDLVGGISGASWRQFSDLLGADLGPSGFPGGLLGLVRVSWRHLGAEGADFRFLLPLLGSSCSRLEGQLGRLWALMGHQGPIGGLFGCLGTVLGVSCAALEHQKLGWQELQKH